MPRKRTYKKKSSRKVRKVSPGSLIKPGHAFVHLRDQTAPIASTSSSGLFELTQVAINFRSTNLGAYLLAIAENFTMYRIHSLKVKYLSLTATSIDGMWAMCYLDDPFQTVTTIEEICANENAKTGHAWESAYISLPVSKKWFYGALQNSEQRLSDNGSFCHATGYFNTVYTPPGLLTFDVQVEFKGASL